MSYPKPTAISHIQRVDVETRDGSRSSDAGPSTHHVKLSRRPVCLNAVSRDAIQVNSLPNFAGLLSSTSARASSVKDLGNMVRVLCHTHTALPTSATLRRHMTTHMTDLMLASVSPHKTTLLPSHTIVVAHYVDPPHLPSCGSRLCGSRRRHSAMVNAVAGVGKYTIKCGGPPVVTRLKGAKVRYDHKWGMLRVEYEKADSRRIQSLPLSAQGRLTLIGRRRCRRHCRRRQSSASSAAISTRTAALDIVADPPLQNVTCLQRHRLSQGKVVLIQVALQTTESNKLAGRVSNVVARDLTFSQYLVLLTVADVFLVMSLHEGMALRTHGFVECQEGRHRPLILSEFMGSYSHSGFRSCIAVNLQLAICCVVH
ncbi:glycosyltransferase family 20 protein [Coniophora puteana RWD-64-598 SS2]|uniref:Glycosyltransferase family 20 protein n=1 Tax=Coniophora puteana (strain RWD-64-598) TaxID=741705 RepID=A0A5M3MHA7_CONPW|nr:glycosyltransferase family 20 protein [Coniophora puteana RWD-64-598 SS2]EIW78015.1 glycosyltransferase family 20 protein [Coniophora puteana RWD-64-598 SS2]